MDGTGKDGGGPRGVDCTLDIGGLLLALACSLLRVIPMSGRDGKAGVAFGSPDICMGGTVSPPSHDPCWSGLGD